MKNQIKILFLSILFTSVWVSACFVSGSDKNQTQNPTVTETSELPEIREENDQIKPENPKENTQLLNQPEIQNSEVKEDTVLKELPPPVSKPKSQQPKKPKLPSISFKETIKEFEEITAGDIIDIRFDFENTGNAPLVVKSASATCGCTVPSYPFIPIEPGENGYIGVTYNSVGKSGEQNPSITIITNANPAKYVLHLHGNVKDKKKEN